MTFRFNGWGTFYVMKQERGHFLPVVTIVLTCGWVIVQKTGNFTVANCLINNSGNHPVVTKTNTINLVTDTIYPIRIQYGEASSGNDINVYFIKPSGGTTKIYDGTGYYFNTLDSI